MKCAHDVENVIRYETPGEVACFIGEPIQGVGGAVTPPKEYFEIVYDIVRKYGGLCIADEVQTGFGRTGEHFWGFENWGVTPDMVTMAKGIGNGAPLGGVRHAARDRRDDEEPRALQHVRRQPDQHDAGPGDARSHRRREHPAERPDRRRPPEEPLAANCRRSTPLIGEVRGMGLMLGVELVRDRKTKEPANTETADVLELCKERGLLIGKGGLFGNTLRIKPPMCITKDDADFLVDRWMKCYRWSDDVVSR